MNEQSPAWENGFHCGHLISPVSCPSEHQADSVEWYKGRDAGRDDMRKSYEKWKHEQPTNAVDKIVIVS